MRDPEGGPGLPALFNDTAFAVRFVKQDIDAYLAIIERSRDALFPDTFVSGPSPDELMRLDTAASIWPVMMPIPPRALSS
jgi:hypothetical protein